MTRRLGWALAVYLPHLAEEALTGMYRDPVVAPAIALFDRLPRAQAIYLAFQLTLIVGFALAFAMSRGGAPARLAMALLALALLAESHHLVRALWSGHYNPGLVTAFPMPIVGAAIVIDLWRTRVAP